MNKLYRRQKSVIFILITHLFFQSFAVPLNTDIPEKCLKKCKSIDKKIEILEQKKRDLLQLIEDNTELQQLKKEATELQQSIQTHKLSQLKKYYQTCLNLLDELELFNTTITRPHVLHELDTLLPVIKQYENESCINALLRERVHLLECSDQFFALQSIQKQLNHFRHSCLQHINELSSQINLLPATTLLKEHGIAYKNHMLLKQLNDISFALWKLKKEKEVKLLKQHEYLNYLYEKESDSEPITLFEI